MPEIRKRESASKKPRHWWGRLYSRLVNLHGSPARIAGGVAVGVAFGVGPTFIVGMPLAVVLATFFRFNVAAALLGVMIGLPPFLPITWGGSCYLGGVILGLDWEVLYANVRAGEIWQTGGDIVLAFIVGNAIVTAALTSVAYLVTDRVVRWSRRKSSSRTR